MSKWTENKIQFPRLIAELNMAGAFTEEVMTGLQASMDLTGPEIHELIARAELSFELLKKSEAAEISLDPIPLCPLCLNTRKLVSTIMGGVISYIACPQCCELPKLEDIKLPGETDG